MSGEKIDNKEQLTLLAKELRYVITDIICQAGSGHIGGALSLVEIITTLYYRIMNVKPSEPRWADRDRLVLSKGHAGPVLYAALAYKGYFPKEWLPTLNKPGTRLPSHCDQIRTPGIDMTAGFSRSGTFRCNRYSRWPAKWKNAPIMCSVLSVMANPRKARTGKRQCMPRT